MNGPLGGTADKRPGQKCQVFLSFYHGDEKAARQAYEALTRSGRSVFFAGQTIQGGHHWHKEILRALRDCQAFVLVLSHQTDESAWVPKEINEAINLRRPIIPFVVDEGVRGEVAFMVSTEQHIRAWPSVTQAALDDLVRTVNAQMAQPMPWVGGGPGQRMPPEIYLGHHREVPQVPSQCELPRATFEATVRDIEDRRRRNFGLACAGLGLVVLVTAGLMVMKGRLGGEVVASPPISIDRPSVRPPRPEELAKEYGASVAIVDVSWELQDATTRRPLYQRVIENNGVRFRVYVKNKKGRLVPLLTKVRSSGTPVGGRVRGTGFVVKGWRVLTSKRLVQPWKIFQANRKQPSMELRNGNYYPIDAPDGWIPAVEEGVTGYQTRMEVSVGKGESTPIVAAFGKASDTHDVAYLTADVGRFKPLPLADAAGKAAHQGSPIVVIGFPTISAMRFDTKVDPGADTFLVFRDVPSLSVGTGILERIRNPEYLGTSDAMISDAGETYQMSTISISGGGSGSPVFGSDGKVTAMVAMAKSDNATTVTFAVPIKYAIELLGNN